MWTNIRISAETKQLIEDAKLELLRHHPELKGSRITNNHIINQCLDFYIRSW